MHDIHIGAGAQADAENAYVWYEAQHIGLGLKWFQSFERLLISVRTYPHRYAQVSGDIRRARFRRFPYSLYYLVDKNIIVVLGVFHDRQNPDVLRSRF